MVLVYAKFDHDTLGDVLCTQQQQQQLLQFKALAVCCGCWHERSVLHC
jgi:hypothetical protein